jgi:hypothetical protein
MAPTSVAEPDLLVGAVTLCGSDNGIKHGWELKIYTKWVTVYDPFSSYFQNKNRTESYEQDR